MKTERFRRNEEAAKAAARAAKQAERAAALSANRRAAAAINVPTFLQEHEEAAHASLERKRQLHEREKRMREIEANDNRLLETIGHRIEALSKPYNKVGDIIINKEASLNSQLEQLVEDLQPIQLMSPHAALTEIRSLRDQISSSEKKSHINHVIAQLEQRIRSARNRYTELVKTQKDMEAEKQRLLRAAEQEARLRELSAERKVKVEQRAREKAEADARKASAERKEAAARKESADRKESAARKEAAARKESADRKESAARKASAERKEADARKASAERKEADARKESAARKASAARKHAIQSAYKTAATAAAKTATNLDTFKTQLDTLIATTEKEDDEKRTYDGHRSIMLKNTFVQNVILKLISNIHREIYVSKLEDIRAGLNAETSAKFEGGESNIKEHLYRFFLKGGAAATFLFRERRKTPPRIFPLTNDIDCVLLINPSLESKQYKILQVNLMKTIINVIEKFVIRTLLPSHIRVEDEKITPQIYKYYSELYPDYSGPGLTDETRLPKLLDSYASELQMSPFPSLYTNQKKIASEAQIAGDLLAIAAEKQPLHDRLSQITLEIQQMHAIFASNTQLGNRLQLINTQEMMLINYPEAVHQLALLRQQKAIILAQMLTHAAFQHAQQLLATKIAEQRALQTQLAPLQTQYDALQVRALPPDQLQGIKNRITQHYDSYKLKSFTYNVIFNAGYIKNNIQHLFQQSIISVRPKIVDKKYELLDIVIPFKKNGHLRAEWDTYKTQEFKNNIPSAPKDVADVLYNIKHTDDTPIHFDIETVETALLDQLYAIKGTPETLVDKLANRKRRLKYLTARLIKERCSSHKAMRTCVKEIQSKFPEAFSGSGLPSVSGGGLTRKLPRWFRARSTMGLYPTKNW